MLVSSLLHRYLRIPYFEAVTPVVTVDSDAIIRLFLSHETKE